MISRATGIPVAKMMQGEKDKLLQMETRLHQRVVGQQRIENPLSRLLLEGKFAPKQTIHVSVDAIRAPGEFHFS